MDIRKILKAGESDTVEFKSAFGKEVIISLTAFANTNGTGFIRVRELINAFPDVSMNINEMGDFLKIEVVATPKKTPTKTPTKTPIKTPTKIGAPLTSYTVHQCQTNSVSKTESVFRDGHKRYFGTIQILKQIFGT